jgi:uncharacterized protein YjbI with pentapeptide repeats
MIPANERGRAMSHLDRLRDFLERHPAPGMPDTEYYGADLRGADLAGVRLTHFSLRGAILDGADLSGARFVRVDLSGASLREANLEHATFYQVSATKTSLAGARCVESVWRQADLTGADCTGTQWREAFVDHSLLERADFSDADLTWLRLIDCNCAEASFRGAAFEHANTAGSRFTGALFERAKRFLRCREIITEILSREINGDLERAKLVGALAMDQAWCYPEWAKILALQPHFRQVVAEIFRRYPESGFIEALRASAREDGS